MIVFAKINAINDLAAECQHFANIFWYYHCLALTKTLFCWQHFVGIILSAAFYHQFFSISILPAFCCHFQQSFATSILSTAFWRHHYTNNVNILTAFSKYCFTRPFQALFWHQHFANNMLATFFQQHYVRILLNRYNLLFYTFGCLHSQQDCVHSMQELVCCLWRSANCAHFLLDCVKTCIIS